MRGQHCLCPLVNLYQWKDIYVHRTYFGDCWWWIAVTFIFGLLLSIISYNIFYILPPGKNVVWLHVLLDSGDGLLIDLDADLMLIEELVGLGGCAAVATVVGAGGDRGRGYSVPVTRQWRPPRRSRMLAHRSYIYI